MSAHNGTTQSAHTPRSRSSSWTGSKPVGRAATSLGGRTRGQTPGAWWFPTAGGDHGPSSRNDPAGPRRTQRRITKSAGRACPTARGRSSARRKKDPTLIADLKAGVDPETAGNPCSDEKWVRSRLRALSKQLDRRACPTTIGRLLRDQKYGLRSHRKVLHTGKHHAERNRQFEHIGEQRQAFRQSGDPRISVDTKKKELLGQFKNPGQTWCQEATKVNDHDFPGDAKGRAAPYGIY